MVVVRGAGDLGSGVVARLQRAGLRVLVLELPQPLVVRRLVSFAETVYRGAWQVEEIAARRVDDLEQAQSCWQAGQVPVMVDPQMEQLQPLRQRVGAAIPLVLVDARLTKKPPERLFPEVDFVIGLGPGFQAGVNCHAAIETNRGHRLGRVYWQGAPEPDTGIPEGVGAYRAERVLRAPCAGVFQPVVEIGAVVAAGQLLARVDAQAIVAPFAGAVRGLIHAGLPVTAGAKVGDLDPRGDPEYCRLISDKALAIGGGVLEAILSRPELRPYLWEGYATKAGAAAE